jgi:hypothetical protein
MTEFLERERHILDNAKPGDTIIVSVSTATGAITCTTAPTRPWDMVRVAQVILDAALDMADQQPGKPWDEAASIGENFTDMCLDEDDRVAGEDD